MGSHLGLICSKGPGLWGTVPCPLGTFDTHPQGRLGTFKIKMAAHNAKCLILVAFTEKKRGTVNSLTVCQFWHLSYNPDVQHIRSALRNQVSYGTVLNWTLLYQFEKCLLQPEIKSMHRIHLKIRFNPA